MSGVSLTRAGFIAVACCCTMAGVLMGVIITKATPSLEGVKCQLSHVEKDVDAVLKGSREAAQKVDRLLELK